MIIKIKLMMILLLCTAFGFIACGGGGGGGGGNPTYSISGTVDVWYGGYGVTINVTGSASGETQTDEDGIYTLSDLPDGDYTVTPSLDGYAFDNEYESVTISGADVSGIDFTCEPTTPSYSIAGTISYSGTKNGPVFIVIEDYNPIGTSRPLTGTTGSRTANYIISGLPGDNHTYTVKAFQDTIGSRSENKWNPSGSATITIDGTSQTGVNITLDDPDTFTVGKPEIGVLPSNGSAIIFAGEDVEDADTTAAAYRIYWGTTSTPSDFLVKLLPGKDCAALQAGITNGTYYYKAVPLDESGTEVASSASDVAGPVTIGPGTGGYSVSGTVSFSGSTLASGAGIFIILEEAIDDGDLYFTGIKTSSAVSSQAFAISNVQNGTYRLFAIIDKNGSGTIDLGDLESGRKIVILNGSNLTGQSLTVPMGLNFNANIRSHSQKRGLSVYYGLDFELRDMNESVVAATVISGKNMPLTHDIGLEDGEFQTWISLADKPAVGDEYLLSVIHIDQLISPTVTSEYITKTISAVLEFFATGLSTSGSSTTPTFHWTMPITGLPANHIVRIRVQPSGGGDYLWEYLLSSAQITAGEIAYNYDGEAEQGTLVSGIEYHWCIIIQDYYGNSAAAFANYTP